MIKIIVFVLYTILGAFSAYNTGKSAMTKEWLAGIFWLMLWAYCRWVALY